MTSSDVVLDTLFAARKPVVLYVHGRGREPGKTLKKDIIRTLERDYDVKVLMFNWDSAVPLVRPLFRPVASAQASGAELRDLILRISKYRDAHPETASVPVSLLVHSMGNITLHAATNDSDLTPAGRPLFANILMTGSDEDANGHKAWVEKLQAQHTVMITINRQDGTLARSHHPDGVPALGTNPAPPLAANAVYFDVSDQVGAVHRLFQKSNQHGRVAVCKVFTALLRGEAPDLSNSTAVKELKQSNLIVPSNTVAKNDSCFSGVSDSPDLDDDD